MNTICEILRYPAILLIDILGTESGAWSADPSNALNERRVVSVEARVIEYLKGSGPLGDAAFVVTQRRPAVDWPSGDYGPWSAIDLEARPQLLAFLTSA